LQPNAFINKVLGFLVPDLSKIYAKYEYDFLDKEMGIGSPN